jgi:hypothetical protein
MKSRYDVLQDPRQQRALALLRGIPAAMFATAVLALALVGGDGRQMPNQQQTSDVALAADCSAAPAANCDRAHP